MSDFAHIEKDGDKLKVIVTLDGLDDGERAELVRRSLDECARECLGWYCGADHYTLPFIK